MPGPSMGLYSRGSPEAAALPSLKSDLLAKGRQMKPFKAAENCLVVGPRQFQGGKGNERIFYRGFTSAREG